MKSSIPLPEDQARLQSDTYQLGVIAAENGRSADACPFPTGVRRKYWLAGFFSARPPAKCLCKNIPEGK
jgi:ribosome modulation factor